MENNNEVSKATMMEQEIMRGRDMANQLLQVVVDSRNEEEIERSTVMPFAEDAVRKVLRSFTNTLLLLNNEDTKESSCNSNNNKKNSSSNKSQKGYHKRNEDQLHQAGRVTAQFCVRMAMHGESTDRRRPSIPITSGATTSAATRMKKIAKPSNMFRESKRILHYTVQPIMAITLANALSSLTHTQD
ncbi:hypothetical protein S245_024970 [Arachis hypogaea]